MSSPEISRVGVERFRLELRNVRIGSESSTGIIIDEIDLEAGEIQVEIPHGDAELSVRGGDCKIRAMITEPNINASLVTNLDGSGSLRNIKVSLMSGRARVSGQFVKLITLPFSIDATPVISNGVRVSWECERAKLGVGVPSALLEILEKALNEKLSMDLSTFPIPLWLDTLRCEPGRFTMLGKAKAAWPLGVGHVAVAPFGPREARPQSEIVATSLPVGSVRNEILTAEA